jgi:hypothetical protein
MRSPGRRRAQIPVSDRRTPVHERTALQSSAENIQDLHLNAVGVDLVLEEA